MIVDYTSKDCFLLITDIEYESFCKIAMSYLLKYTDYDIVLYTCGYHSTIRNPRIQLKKFEIASGSQQFNFMNCKPFISLDAIENTDYDRIMYLDSDMIFTEQVKNAFTLIKGYTEEVPLYPVAPVERPTLYSYLDTDGNVTKTEDRLDHYYAFNGKLYSPERNPRPPGYRMGHIYVFNKSCRTFYQDVVCQMKTASSHPEQSVFMKMKPLKDEPAISPLGSGFRYPINSEEGYINSTLWKYSSARSNTWEPASYLPLYVQELYDKDHYDWVLNQYNKNDQDTTAFPLHPLWKYWIPYPNLDLSNSAKWLGVPINDDESKPEPFCYHFSLQGNKSFFHHLHKMFGGHDESIFNC